MQTGKAAPRKACWKSGELSVQARGLCKLRLTLGFVRKSAVSGNSTGGRMPMATGLWAGEATGLRLGEAPGIINRCEDKTPPVGYTSAGGSPALRGPAW